MIVCCIMFTILHFGAYASITSDVKIKNSPKDEIMFYVYPYFRQKTSNTLLKYVFVTLTFASTQHQQRDEREHNFDLIF